jgi:hypothetical protein
MEQFTVPQFIDVEPKIIGPITTRQFLIFLGAALLIFLSYRLLYFTSFVFVSVFIFAVSGVFAFLKINGRPFHFFLLNFIQSILRPSLRIWNHKLVDFNKKEEKTVKYEKNLPPDKYFDKKRLAELSLIIDSKGRYKGEDREQIELEEDYS